MDQNLIVLIVLIFILLLFSSPKQKQLSHSDIFEDVIEEDHLECKFNVNSYKIVYVSGTEDFMYRKKSLSKAIKVRKTIHIQ